LSLGVGKDNQAYQKRRMSHWDEVARIKENTRSGGVYYHHRLIEIHRHLIPPGSRILELGCGNGDLLGSLEPSFGLGVDFSHEMVKLAKSRHPGRSFSQADAHFLPLSSEDPFDFIILSDLLNDVWDVEAIFSMLKNVMHPRTRIVINIYSRLWGPILTLAEKLRLAKPNLNQNWLTVDDIRNLLHLAGFEVIRNWEEVLLPLPVPLLMGVFNKFLIRFWPFRLLALTNFIIARPAPVILEEQDHPSVSIIVPARNEEGNVPVLFQRIPDFGADFELVFVEGHSGDGTYDAIAKEMKAHPFISCQLLRQKGIGKGDAVRAGFDCAKGDILMILDADLTVPPEDLPRFYEVLRSRKGEFANGVRLVYPMHEKAMQFLNLLGNKFFSLLFSWLLGQPIKDTLCGTKALRREDYDIIASNRAYFGEFDPFGDFDLLLGAARQNRKIVDIPIRYRERTYGSTNISRWRHGLLLLKMAWFAARRLKFV